MCTCEELEIIINDGDLRFKTVKVIPDEPHSPYGHAKMMTIKENDGGLCPVSIGVCGGPCNWVFDFGIGSGHRVDRVHNISAICDLCNISETQSANEPRPGHYRKSRDASNNSHSSASIQLVIYLKIGQHTFQPVATLHNGIKISMNTRSEILHIVTAEILRLDNSRILRIAVDGVDGSGKTTFADEIASLMRGKGRQIIRCSVDDFHNPKAVRYCQGRQSPKGFFEDSYNYHALRSYLLDPLSPGGNALYRTAIFDVQTDRHVVSEPEFASADAILIIDGIFLHRPELRDYWDYSIFLHVPFDISIPRGAQRGPGYGSPDPDAASNQRYIEGQKLYLSACTPERIASVVIDNSKLDAPNIIKRF